MSSFEVWELNVCAYKLKIMTCSFLGFLTFDLLGPFGLLFDPFGALVVLGLLEVVGLLVGLGLLVVVFGLLVVVFGFLVVLGFGVLFTGLDKIMLEKTATSYYFLFGF